MRLQGSTIPNATTTLGPLVSRPTRQLSATTFTGLAAIIGKIRQIVRGETLRPIDSLSELERDELHQLARAVVNLQIPEKRMRALELAKERAEAVIAEEGAIASDAARFLARRIAAEALITYQFALEGAFELPTGGGQ